MDTPVIPNISGLTDLVYVPAEDSFLLLDALEADLPNSFPHTSKDILFALEVGCGSGIISTAIAKSDQLLNERIPCVFAADVNPYACLLTEKTGEKNNIFGSTLHTLLLDGKDIHRNPFKMEFDLIVCNPPYVPIQDGENQEDEQSGIIKKSWDGGPDGNQFIIPFLSNIGRLLKTNGWLYMLLSSWNNPEMLANDVAFPNGLRGTQVMSRVAGRERLSVWKFHKSV